MGFFPYLWTLYYTLSGASTGEAIDPDPAETYNLLVDGNALVIDGNNLILNG